MIGRGISLITRGTGSGEGSSDITVHPDGTITALTSMPDNGTGGLTVVAQVVAESFGVPVNRVRVVQGGTDDLPIDVGSGGSKMTNVAGNAAMQASERVKIQLAPVAARMLGSEVVEWVPARIAEDGAVQAGGWRPAAAGRPDPSGRSPDGKFVSLEDLAMEMIRADDPAAHVQVTMNAPRAETLSYCAQAAEVEVDAETGEVRLRRMVTVNDVGTIINAIGHQSQIEGAVLQGVGYALMEELVVEDGRIATGNLGDYKMPTIQDIPPLTTINVQQASGPGPFEAKGIGEMPTIPTAGAITNAVSDAIGKPIMALPLTAEQVLTALERQES